jgi:hypothetical protein
MLAVAVNGFGDLHRQLACRGEDEALHRAQLGVELLDDRQRERGRLAGAGGGAPQHVAAREQQGNRVDLDRRRLFVAELVERRDDIRAQAERFESKGIRDGFCHRRYLSVAAVRCLCAARCGLGIPCPEALSGACKRRAGRRGIWDAAARNI